MCLLMTFISRSTANLVLQRAVGGNAAYPAQYSPVIVSRLPHDYTDRFTLQVQLHNLRTLLGAQTSHSKYRQCSFIVAS